MGSQSLAHYIIAVLYVVSLCMGGCKKMDKFEWLPSESAPEAYPVEIVRGVFVLADGNSVFIPDGKLINNNWGEGYSTHLVGSLAKALPVQLEISWFSYGENLFFSGRFTLPKEKIFSLFKKGVNDGQPGERTPISQVVVGLLPRGRVSLWLAGGGTVIEVAKFIAEPASIPWEQILDDDEITRETYIRQSLEDAMSPEMLVDFDAYGITDNAWVIYQKRYSWRFVMGSDTVEFLSMRVNTFNGESEFIDFSEQSEKRDRRGIPKRLIVRWADSSGEAYKSDIVFNKPEVVAAFEELSGKNDDLIMTLEVEVSGNTGKVNIALSNQTLYLPMEKCDIKLY